MYSITLQDIKRNGANALKESGPGYLIVNSRLKSVILPISEYEMLTEALEELEDIRAIEERKDEKTIKASKFFKSNRI